MSRILTPIHEYRYRRLMSQIPLGRSGLPAPQRRGSRAPPTKGRAPRRLHKMAQSVGHLGRGPGRGRVGPPRWNRAPTPPWGQVDFPLKGRSK